MLIDKIGNIGKILQTDKNKGAKPVQSSSGMGRDSVSISQEAVKAQEVAQTANVVRKSPDIRADRVKEVKEKMARGDYDNIGEEMLNKVADKIADSLLRM